MQLLRYEFYPQALISTRDNSLINMVTTVSPVETVDNRVSGQLGAYIHTVGKTVNKLWITFAKCG